MSDGPGAARREDVTTPIPGGRLALLALALVAGSLGSSLPDVDAVPSTAPTGGAVSAASAWRDDGGERTVLHVSPSGSDAASGSADEPFASLEHALEQLRPGWTLVVHDGVYQEDLSELDVAPGRADRPIRVRAADGAEPLLVGLLWLRDADYWHVSGLDVTWDTDDRADQHMVKFQGGRGWVFEDAELSHARSYAALLIAGDARRFRVSRLHVHDTHRSNDTNQDHLVYVSADTDGGVIEHSLLVGSENGRGIKVGTAKPGDDAIGDLDIRYNTFYDNRGPSNLQLSYSARKVRIYRNIFARSGSETTSITAYRLEGDDSIAYDNIATGSDGVLPDKRSGIRDMGGNRMLDPDFADPDSGDFRPQDREAQAYGAYATPPASDD